MCFRIPCLNIRLDNLRNLWQNILEFITLVQLEGAAPLFY